jgi:methionyl-tRNA synthetase
VARAKFYLTTPIYYVNDLPHIGHIYTTVVADVVARYKRLAGYEVYFLTGTDEHGQNVERAAQRQGIPPKQLADQVVGRYHELWQTLGITHDDFIRTTEPRHARGVAAIIQRIAARGDIYLDRHSGWYCPSCEAFYTEKELGEGRLCPTHEKPAEWHEEENLFFRLSAYQQALLEHYQRHPEFIRPASRLNEVARFVEGGLKDLSISRVTLKWGIPFPGHEQHVVYVWLDALTNYISALGFGSQEAGLYERFWPADLHLVGKDILRFHCVYWPAFLLSAGLPLPRQVWGHGWWLKDDKKMSKSVGNVVRPDELIRRFGADPLRYFLLREMTFGQDASFSDEAFLKRYNADLANGLGNTASRVLAMARRYFAGRTPATSCNDNVVKTKAEEVVTRYREAMDGYEFHRALEAAWELLATVDGYVNEKAPWSLARREGASSPALQRILYNCLEGVRLVATMAAPVMPQACRRLLTQLGEGEPVALDVALRWGGLATEQPLGGEETLFPRADTAEYFGEVKVSETTASQQPAASEVTPAPAEETQIGIEEFARVKLVVGTVKVAERVPKSSKLIRMEVDLGEPTLRQIVAGIGKQYTPEQLVGRQIVVVANLKPAVLMGVTSNGMVLAASVDGAPFLLSVDQPVPPGTGVR